jgi:hypothetical protein
LDHGNGEWKLSLKFVLRIPKIRGNMMEKGRRKSNLIPFGGKSPFVEEGVFVDPTSRIMGDVTLRSGASVWPLAVLRADSDAIVIEANSVILDKVLVEAPMGHNVLIEGDVIISHGAILHGWMEPRWEGIPSSPVVAWFPLGLGYPRDHWPWEFQPKW